MQKRRKNEITLLGNIGIDIGVKPEVHPDRGPGADLPKNFITNLVSQKNWD